MFESLSERLSGTFRHIIGKGKLTEDNIKKPLKEVRNALIEADVSISVVKRFVKDVAEKAKGLEITKSLSPAQELVKLVNDQLVIIMGDKNEELNLKASAPAVILMAGLQGSGKTTTSAKLALLLKERFNQSVMLVSADVYRPAAIEQLKTLANEVGAAHSDSNVNETPIDIVERALQEAKDQLSDVLIVDTAGRLDIDQDMMEEIKTLHQRLNPIETLFVVDGMTGQIAANTAKAFNDALSITGVVVSKLDGDARGGAILSIRETCGKPIKFIGVGEKVDGLEPFYPDRMASRILGMGDVLSLVEDLERKLDKNAAEKLAKKVSKGQGFNLNDLKSQLEQMQKMGGIGSMMDKLPGMGAIPQEAKEKANDGAVDQMLAIIGSMTKLERKKPDIIKGSRKRRIAKGSGTDVQDVNRLIKQFNQMQKMMKKFSKKGSMEKMLKGMSNMLPPGMMPPNR